MAALKELLVGTIGLARLARGYADVVLTRKIDGAESGLAIGPIKVFAFPSRDGTSKGVGVVIERDDATIEMSRGESRDLFAVLYGLVSCEYDEPLDDGAANSLALAISLLRSARRLLDNGTTGDAENFRSSLDAFLANFPAAKP